MARVVCVHGIAQEYEVEDSLLTDWAPRLCGSVKLAGGRLDPSDIRLAFYGVLFRPSGGTKDGPIPSYRPGDVDDGLETDILGEWAAAVEAIQEPAALGPLTGPTKSQLFHRTKASMLQVLGNAPVLGAVAQKLVIWYLKQVRLYLTNDDIRQRARQALLDVTADDTRVYVAHSLGSVVAYEVLCANPSLPVRTLVTIGSPLGVKAIHPCLDPAVVAGPGTWPKGLRAWTNVADGTDMVALVKQLAPTFANVSDVMVHNGATMHDCRPYLTAVETGKAVAAGLSM